MRPCLWVLYANFHLNYHGINMFLIEMVKVMIGILDIQISPIFQYFENHLAFKYWTSPLSCFDCEERVSSNIY